MSLFCWLLPSVPGWIQKVEEEGKSGCKKSCGCVLTVKWYFPLQWILQNSWKTHKQSASGRSQSRRRRHTESKEHTHNRYNARIRFFAFRSFVPLASLMRLDASFQSPPVLSLTFFYFFRLCCFRAHNTLSLAFGDFCFFSLSFASLLQLRPIYCTHTHIPTQVKNYFNFSFWTCSHLIHPLLDTIAAKRKWKFRDMKSIQYTYLHNINNNNNFDEWKNKGRSEWWSSKCDRNFAELLFFLCGEEKALIPKMVSPKWKFGLKWHFAVTAKMTPQYEYNADINKLWNSLRPKGEKQYFLRCWVCIVLPIGNQIILLTTQSVNEHTRFRVYPKYIFGIGLVTRSIALLKQQQHFK